MLSIIIVIDSWRPLAAMVGAALPAGTSCMGTYIVPNT